MNGEHDDFLVCVCLLEEASRVHEFFDRGASAEAAWSLPSKSPEIQFPKYEPTELFWIQPVGLARGRGSALAALCILVVLAKKIPKKGKRRFALA